MSEAIRVEHLNYAYPGVDDTPGVSVFVDLNLTIEEGSFVAILGSNGCGKSTLAKHFNSILLPCGGKVYVCGLDTSDDDLLMKVRRHVGMVFQNPDNQIVANVVEEDVAFGPENLGVASPEIRHRVDKALKQVGMYEYRGHAPHLLSGGPKQRVALARAMTVGADLLILDELSYLSFNRHQSELLFKVISDRSEKSSTIVTTNLPFSKWTELFENTTMVAALIDRLTFRSHVMDMNGDSYRLKATMQSKK